MAQLSIERDLSGIEGLSILTPTLHADPRGYFMETYNANDFRDLGFNLNFVQDNESKSVRGVLRGLHYQKEFPQTKLVRVVVGEVFDVALDLRKSSKTYGKWHGVLLSAENKKQFLIPRGFAHGFLVISDVAQFCYKCDDFYHPGDEGGILFSDGDIKISWPVLDTPLIMSEKDKTWPLLRDSKVAF